jgi:hypothetical protein
MIAYGKFSTGKKDEDFDLMKLEGGDGSTCFNTLVYGVNSYSKERNISKRKRLYCLGRERSNRNSRRSKEADDRQNFVNELKIALKNFSPETLMTVGINQ